MNELLSTINTFLTDLPWWVVAIVTAIGVRIFSGKIDINIHTDVMKKRSVSDQFRATLNPIQFSSSSGVKFQKSGINYASKPSTDVSTSEFSLEGQDAEHLFSLIRSGKKIEAIKYIREKKSLELVDAKNIVDAMSKFP